MPDSVPPQSAPASWRGSGPTALLWAGFVAVHAWLIFACATAVGWPLGDVDVVYLGWATDAATGAAVVGITAPFVYPILAIVPILAALAFGAAHYTATWLGLVTVLNAVAFAGLVGFGAGSGTRIARGFGPGRRPGRGPGPAASARSRLAAAWWLGFLLLLGPIALARIDSITVPLVILAVLWLRTRPVWGTVVLTIATWVKVWPIALIGALLVASTQRARVLYALVGTSAVIVAVALGLGSGATVFSFIGEQANRGIQIESPVGAIWMVQAALQLPGSYIYYDHAILTFQVVGPGSTVAVALMTPLLVLAIAAVLLLAVRANRAGAPVERLLPPLVLALVVTLMAVNKVGSPQFITWLAAPAILGILYRGRAWLTPTVLISVIAALTQLVYPYLYDWLLAANPLLVLALSIRNLLEFVLLAWALREIWALGARTEPAPPGRARPALIQKE